MSERVITMAEAVNEALAEEMARDNRVFLLGEDVGVYGGIFGATKGLLDKFGPERVRDTPISEAAIGGLAVGAALMGMHPVAEFMYEDFTLIAMDQIVNHAAKLHYMSAGSLSVPLVIRTQGGSGRGNAGQHSQSLEVWFAHIPGLIVIMPSTPYDAKGLLKAAIRDGNPVVFIEHKMMYRNRGVVPAGEYLLPIGKADVKRSGKDITVIATQWMVQRALDAAQTVAAEGISVEVIDPRTLRPLDKETILASVGKTHRVLVVHEAATFCGVGAEISAMIMEKGFDELDAPVVRLGGVDTPIPYSHNLEAAAVPTQEQITDTLRALAPGAL
jgi:acetoin:2,6-dichlorophenolindophenol oxidoreductase subunit beta